MTQADIGIAPELLQVLTSLPEKFVVDLANGIHVNRDHLRRQGERGGFFARMYDTLNGAAARRQGEINSNVNKGIDGALRWLTELTQAQARSNLAITRVNERILALQGDVTLLANYSADTREQLEALSRSVGERVGSLAQDLARIDLKQRAGNHVELIFNRWRAGRFGAFAIYGRCYVAMEELRWGVFGDYCRSLSRHERSGVIESVVNRSIGQMKEDAGCEASTRLDTRRWLAPAARPDAASLEALAYLSDWANAEAAPFAFAAAQRPEVLPLAVPRLSSAGRLTEALAVEIFADA